MVLQSTQYSIIFCKYEYQGSLCKPCLSLFHNTLINESLMKLLHQQNLYIRKCDLQLQLKWHLSFPYGALNAATCWTWSCEEVGVELSPPTPPSCSHQLTELAPFHLLPWFLWANHLWVTLKPLPHSAADGRHLSDTNQTPASRLHGLM